jgi:hypothetical protein
MVTSQQAKKLLALHGKTRPQSPKDWTGTFQLPSRVARFYHEVGPVGITIEASGNPYFLPSLANLWQFQAGYRWNGLSGEAIEDWNDDWLVVADEGGDPFIFVRSTGAVLHAFHGEGEWNPSKMFPGLNAMAACLAQLGAIVVEAGESFTDPECCIRPEWKKEARIKLQSLLGSRNAAKKVLNVLGWGSE